MKNIRKLSRNSDLRNLNDWRYWEDNKKKREIDFMIMINGDWQQVKDLSDVLRIASENIGDEFAQIIKEIVESNEWKIKELEMDILELRLKEDYLKELNKQLDFLENYIEKIKMELII